MNGDLTNVTCTLEQQNQAAIQVVPKVGLSTAVERTKCETLLQGVRFGWCRKQLLLSVHIKKKRDFGQKQSHLFGRLFG
jgi:hypothetical protein